jgi:transglutaminase-like putative cysteine protease
MPTVVTLLLALGFLPANAAPGLRTLGMIEREVAFSQIVACSSPTAGGTVRDVSCTAAIPESNPRQEVVVEWISPGGHLLRDGFGNLVLRVEKAELPPGETFEIGWRARIRVQAAIHDVPPSSLASPLAIPRDVLVRYLGDAEVYGLADPDLRAAAEAVRAAASNPLDLAFRLNELVRNRISYERDGRWDPAPVVWKRGTGSCSEYHYVFANLCRNAGLPVRWVGATALRSAADEYVDTVFHRWSEVYLAGYGWFPVDVSRNDCEDGGPVNEAFGRTSAGLLELSRGDGGDALGWGYVSDVRGSPEGGAEVKYRRRVTWTLAPGEKLPPLPLASLVGR